MFWGKLYNKTSFIKSVCNKEVALMLLVCNDLVQTTGRVNSLLWLSRKRSN